MTNETLLKYWGYDSFRPLQEDAINSITDKINTLLVLPTGGGKSLCFQVPTVAADGFCLVISPLISLMQDQVQDLVGRGIPAVVLGSSQSDQKAIYDAWAGRYSFVYMSPEFAVSHLQCVKDMHDRRRITLLAIDEAHCISEWGHDFRPVYRQLTEFRIALDVSIPVLAVTATATPDVRADIVNTLMMGSSVKCFIGGFSRPNLCIQIQQRPPMGLDFLMSKINEKLADGPLLVYALTRKNVQEILERARFPCVGYHAGMTQEARDRSHRSFLQDKTPVMVATVAYGMGINKKNIRTIVHWGMPGCAEAFYQQIGRAGRDGAPASCLMFWSAADSMMVSAEDTPAQRKRRILFADFCCNAPSKCRHAWLISYFEGAASELGYSADAECAGGGCDSCNRRLQSIRTTGTRDEMILLAGVGSFGGRVGAAKVLDGIRGKSTSPDWMQKKDGFGKGRHLKTDLWKSILSKSADLGWVHYKTISIGTENGKHFLSPMLTSTGRNILADSSSHTAALSFESFRFSS